MAWQCPKCKSTELDVTVQVWARLIQDEDGENFSTDADDSENGSDHEWDSESVMKCRECQYGDRAGEFDTDNRDDEETAEASC